MRILLLAGVVLALGAASGVALARDEQSYDWQHQYDHEEHGGYHDEAARTHALAHELGLADDPYSHARLHQALEEQHQGFHEDHPGTWHDHYRQRAYRSYYGQGYTPYGYGYRDTRLYEDSNPYAYSPY